MGRFIYMFCPPRIDTPWVGGVGGRVVCNGYDTGVKSEYLSLM